jgi:hypothetical protein
LPPHRGGLGGGKGALDAGDAADYTAVFGASAVRKGTRAGLEVARVPEEIPAVGVISGPAEIVLEVGHVPRLSGMKGQDGVDLPTLQ